jgi:hypothetical protein
MQPKKRVQILKEVRKMVKARRNLGGGQARGKTRSRG